MKVCVLFFIHFLTNRKYYYIALNLLYQIRQTKYNFLTQPSFFRCICIDNSVLLQITFPLCIYGSHKLETHKNHHNHVWRIDIYTFLKILQWYIRHYEFYNINKFNISKWIFCFTAFELKKKKTNGNWIR